MGSVQSCSSIPMCPFENLLIFVLKLLFPYRTEHWFLFFSEMNPFPRDFTCQSILITSSCLCSSKHSAGIQKGYEMPSLGIPLDRKQITLMTLRIRTRHFQYINLPLTDNTKTINGSDIVWPSICWCFPNALSFDWFTAVKRKASVVSQCWTRSGFK